MHKNTSDSLYQKLNPKTLRWTTYCESAACVMVADLEDGGIALRDSKLGEDGPVLAFTAAEMRDALPELLKKYNLQ